MSSSMRKRFARTVPRASAAGETVCGTEHSFDRPPHSSTARGSRACVCYGRVHSILVEFHTRRSLWPFGAYWGLLGPFGPLDGLCEGQPARLGDLMFGVDALVPVTL